MRVEEGAISHRDPQVALSAHVADTDEVVGVREPR
jgi:hypothetical protein